MTSIEIICFSIYAGGLLLFFLIDKIGNYFYNKKKTNDRQDSATSNRQVQPT
jgi:hypothetical protein